MINNYRVNFGGNDIDYRDNFRACRRYFSVLEQLYTLMERHGIDDAWHFFEPYVEFTWVPSGPRAFQEQLLDAVLDVLADNNIETTLIHKPENGVIVDWYCKNPEEQEFGYKTYAASAKMAMLFWKYREAIEKGCGEEHQFMRRPHVLANQIGMNYEQEAWALHKRSSLAKMFWDEGDHAKAVEIYESEFDEKYL